MGPKIRACPPHASGRSRHMGHDPSLQDAAERLVRTVADHAARTILRVCRTISGGVHLAAWDIVFVQNLEEEVGFITARPRPDQRVEMSHLSHAFRIAGIARCADELRLADQGHEFCKQRSGEHTYELQSIMSSSYAVFTLITTPELVV